MIWLEWKRKGENRMLQPKVCDWWTDGHIYGVFHSRKLTFTATISFKISFPSLRWQQQMTKRERESEKDFQKSGVSNWMDNWRVDSDEWMVRRWGFLLLALSERKNDELAARHSQHTPLFAVLIIRLTGKVSSETLILSLTRSMNHVIFFSGKNGKSCQDTRYGKTRRGRSGVKGKRAQKICMESNLPGQMEKPEKGKLMNFGLSVSLTHNRQQGRGEKNNVT